MPRAARTVAKGFPGKLSWVAHGLVKLFGISSIHLLKSFIDTKELLDGDRIWQVGIHVTFLVSAVALAWIERLTAQSSNHKTQNTNLRPLRIVD
jgi:uncharacterized protein (TIGR00645 family)